MTQNVPAHLQESQLVAVPLNKTNHGAKPLQLSILLPRLCAEVDHTNLGHKRGSRSSTKKSKVCIIDTKQKPWKLRWMFCCLEFKGISFTWFLSRLLTMWIAFRETSLHLTEPSCIWPLWNVLTTYLDPISSYPQGLFQGFEWCHLSEAPNVTQWRVWWVSNDFFHYFWGKSLKHRELHQNGLWLTAIQRKRMEKTHHVKLKTAIKETFGCWKPHTIQWLAAKEQYETNPLPWRICSVWQLSTKKNNMRYYALW